ncbi:MAG TPA: acyl-CoA dehydrogenase family protein [Acidimicrobiales bacterium]|nr:acyl-CoA dehydrogenase family protein [Acidimicrobiales bacterium]
MDFRWSAEDEAFREEVRSWLKEHLVGEYAALGSGGGPADETGWDVRLEWEKQLGEAGWIGLGWPKEYGGRGASITQQLIFNEEYAKANAPARVSFFGEGLLGPTLIAFGTEEQKQRFLPGILKCKELWCQGFSEPDAGSDLANVKTRAILDGDEWVVNGQKVWTTLAHHSDWIFAVCRTDPEAPKHKGLSFILLPMDQPGIDVKPLKQLTGSAEFNEVFFTDARTSADLVVGNINEGWKVAMGTLGFERGTAFLAQQLHFQHECEQVIDYAKKQGLSDDPIVRQKLADAWIGVQIMKYNGFRSITKMLATGSPPPEASISKLYWSHWHRHLGELEMELMGPWSEVLAGPNYELEEFQSSFLLSRAETIYTGSTEIQKNIIGERVLGLPREPAAS